MNLDPDSIDGSESRDAATPAGALGQFYAAFNARDLAGMRAVWAEDPGVSMDNPIGGIARGWDAIGGTYRRLFEGPARVRVEFHDYTLHETSDAFLAVGRERGSLVTAAGTLALAFRTSRWFVRRDGMYRQLHHHGSIEDPVLLAEYRNRILGNRA